MCFDLVVMLNFVSDCVPATDLNQHHWVSLQETQPLQEGVIV